MQNSKNLILGDEVRKIVGCAFEVLNTLGCGLLEKPYENALCVEFRLQGIPFVQQPRYQVTYKEVPIGDYIPDLVVFEHIIVDTKVISAITDIERGQMLNYLKITGNSVGILLNFKHPRLEWERLVLTSSNK
ncbi:MAG: GxxExxY protein [Victivallaceae bacterium]|nr:GxxExxY protein [Victivallaceae bacterium]